MKKPRVYETASQKRDAIIDRELLPETTEKSVASGNDSVPAGYAEAQRQFESYILAHGKRFTPERAFVLKQIYALKAPVDISTFYEMVCKEQGQVALATVYNNLALLVDAHLVRRLDLVGGAMAFYEKTLGVEPHGYAVCQHCGKIRIIQLDGITDQILAQLPKTFQTTDINLQVNCLCKKCQTTLRREAEMERKRAIKQRQETSMAGVQARKTRKKRKSK